MDWNQIVPGCVQTERGQEVATLNCIPAVLQNVVGAALLFAGILALFFIIFSGIKFVTSSGDPKQVEGARKTLTYAIIGLIVILLSYFILNLISYATGVECIKVFGFESCGNLPSGGGDGRSEFLTE